MSEPTIYDSNPEGEPLKLTPKSKYLTEFKERKNVRMVAYCRVSTDRKEQETSLEIQKEHYRTYVSKRENWSLIKIYSDEGISGTSVRRRMGFQQMIVDAKAHKFDMIITKSTSRFARNLLDGIRTMRELLQLDPPVGIIFEDESNFNTLRPDSEQYLSFMLSMAQGESEKKSVAIRTAFKWRCDAKNFLTPVSWLLGYTKDENKEMVIDPEGAKTVKAIFAMFLFGITATHIAYTLTASGKRTGKDNAVWSIGSVTNILRNERYCGDIIAQKTVTTDVLEHKRRKNVGREPLYYFDDHHKAIISRREYIRALLMLKSNTCSSYYNPHYEVEVIREGLLVGFIPLNLAFGGYEADHYLGTELRCKEKTGNYSLRITAASGYRLIRAQEIEHRRAAQMTISRKTLIFNFDCVSRFPDVKHVEILLHPAERLIAIRPSDESNPNAVEWKSKPISAAMTCPVLYNLMVWNDSWKYRIMADCFVCGNERVLIFNLSEPEYQFVEDIEENEIIVNRIKHLLQPREWREEIGADYISQMVASRRAYALSLVDWKTQASALPVEGFPGNPMKRRKRSLQAYLKTLGINYV